MPLLRFLSKTSRITIELQPDQFKQNVKCVGGQNTTVDLATRLQARQPNNRASISGRNRSPVASPRPGRF